MNPDGTVLPSGSTIDFGTVQYSQHPSQVIGIRNDGTAPVTAGIGSDTNYRSDPFITTSPTSTPMIAPGQTVLFTVQLNMGRTYLNSFGPLTVTKYILNEFDQSQTPEPTLNLTANIVPDPPRIVNTINFTSRAPAVYTDASGNKVRVRLSGPGSGTLGFGTSGNANLKDLTLSNTTAASSLTITPLGKARTSIIGNVSIPGSIGRFLAPKVDLVGQSPTVPSDVSGGFFNIGGAIRVLAIGNTTGLVKITINGQTSTPNGGTASAKVLPLQMTGGALADTVFNDLQPIDSIHVDSWIDTHAFTSQLNPTEITGALQAPSIRDLRSRGDFTVGLSTTGPVKSIQICGTLGDPWSIGAAASSVQLASVPASFSASIGGKLDSLTVRHDDAGTIAALSFGQIVIDGNMIGGKLLAGVDLGADGLIGGAQDSLIAGSIDSLEVNGMGTNVFISAGFQPADGLFDNAAGQVIGGRASAIRRMVFRHGVDMASQFIAGAFGRASIPNGVDPARDPHFHLLGG